MNKGNRLGRLIVMMVLAVAGVALVALYAPLSQVSAEVNSTVYVYDANDCTVCHGNDVQNFSGAPLVNKRSVCFFCHSDNHGSKKVAGYTQVYVSGIGYFRSADSVNLPPSSIHTAHNGTSSFYQMSTCKNCHQPVSCTVCHGASSIAHQTHSTTQFTPPSVLVSTGNSVGTKSISCINSSCHGRWSNVAVKRTDGQQLCVNCHPRLGSNAKDSSGHSQAVIDGSHSAPTMESLNFTSGPQSVTCKGCHNMDLAKEHIGRGKDCMVCHGPQSPIPAAVKSVVLNANSTPDKRACTQCHFNMNVFIDELAHPVPLHMANLTGDTNLSVVNGPHATCDTCHNTPQPLMIATTVNSTVYESIYELAKEPVKTYSCLGCHNTKNNIAPKHKALLDGDEMELTSLHAGCTTCHTPGTDFAAKVNTIAENVKKGMSYECTECHSGDTLAKGHTGIIDVKCQECHTTTLTDEHLTNPKTQAANIANGTRLTCGTCHKSTAPEVRLAITTGNTNCLACHNQAHNFSMTQPVPTDIPLYAGYDWSIPQPADVWASETWMPAGYSGGKLLISNRRPATEVTGSAVLEFYDAQMIANGWSKPTMVKDNADHSFFTVKYTNETNVNREVTIFFYGGENHTESPVVSTGYRLEILYK